MKPKAFDIENPDDLSRLYREAAGYLRVDLQAGYGTDTEGRKFAMDALRSLSTRAAIAGGVEEVTVSELKAKIFTKVTNSTSFFRGSLCEDYLHEIAMQFPNGLKIVEEKS